MFISITDLLIEPTDDSTYFAITPIDTMFQPEETIRFDKDSFIEYGEWIQARFFDLNFIIYSIIYIVVSSLMVTVILMTLFIYVP